MCGRYAASRDTEEIVEELQVELDRTSEPHRSVLKNPQTPPAGSADYNIAPTKACRVVLTRQQRQLRLLTWGLVPSWSRDPRTGARMANARAETMLDKPAFAAAARSRRCLVPADGWFEWQVSPVARDSRGKPLRQPFFIHLGDGGLVTFAGLYEFWRDPVLPADDPAAWLVTFAIVTTAAEPGLDRIHDRQPLVLEPRDWTTWLDPQTGPDQLLGLLAGSPPGRFQAYPVARTVGDSRRNGPELLRPLPAGELVGVVDPMTGEVLG